MKPDVNAVFCVMVALSAASQTRGQRYTSPPSVTSSMLPGRTEAWSTADGMKYSRNGLPRPTSDPESFTETAKPSTVTQTEAAVHTKVLTDSGPERQPFTSVPTAAATVGNATPFLSTAAERLFLPLTESPPALQTSTAGTRVPVSDKPLATLSPQTAHTTQDPVSTATQSQLEPPFTPTRKDTKPPGAHPASNRAPVVPTHLDLPSELNVGDEGTRRRSSSPLDPLLAALLSVFIIITAIIFIVLFLKFRQRTSHPEFHRLQDLPMDDLMEDMPLSRYTY